MKKIILEIKKYITDFFEYAQNKFKINIKRPIKFLYQRKTRGWDDSDTWNLDMTFAEYALPRIKRYKEIKIGYPARLKNMNEWDKILDQIIEMFEMILNEDKYIDYTNSKNVQKDIKAYEKKIDKGLKLFSKYFTNLWW